MTLFIRLLILLQQPSARVEGIVVDGTNGAPLKDVQVLFDPNPAIGAWLRILQEASVPMMLRRAAKPCSRSGLGRSIHLTPYLNYGMHIEVGKEQHISQKPDVDEAIADAA